jgi:hypothetical protein
MFYKINNLYNDYLIITKVYHPYKVPDFFSLCDFDFHRPGNRLEIYMTLYSFM